MFIYLTTVLKFLVTNVPERCIMGSVPATSLDTDMIPLVISTCKYTSSGAVLAIA